MFASSARIAGTRGRSSRAEVSAFVRSAVRLDTRFSDDCRAVDLDVEMFKLQTYCRLDDAVGVTEPWMCFEAWLYRQVLEQSKVDVERDVSL